MGKIRKFFGYIREFDKKILPIAGYLNLLEFFLMSAYWMAVSLPLLFFAGGRSALPLSFAFCALEFGTYYLLKGCGLLSAIRMKCTGPLSNPMTTPSGVCAVTSMLLLSFLSGEGRIGLWDMFFIGGVCIIACPFALLAFSRAIGSPVRLWRIYNRLLK